MIRPFKTIEVYVDPAADTQPWMLESMAEVVRTALEGYTDVLRVRVLTAPAQGDSMEPHARS